MKNNAWRLMLVGFAVAMWLSGCASTRNAHSMPPKLGTTEWYLEVEEKTGVVDQDGHGPDTGSVEWLEAVSSNIEVYDKLGHGPDLDSDEWKRCVHRKVFKTEPNK